MLKYTEYFTSRTKPVMLCPLQIEMHVLFSKIILPAKYALCDPVKLLFKTTRWEKN